MLDGLLDGNERGMLWIYDDDDDDLMISADESECIV